MGNLSKEHRADALQADAWLRDSETLATTRAVPSRAPAAAAPKEEVCLLCVCVCVCVWCDAPVPCDDPLTTPLAVFRVSHHQEPVNLLELKRKVCEVLLPEETVQQALQRLGKTIKLARAAQVSDWPLMKVLTPLCAAGALTFLLIAIGQGQGQGQR
jgi:hypothetical protein